ncbi:transmembrane protein 254-like [Saccoglossus kowalevskii]|uniref:Transmembrane protein 254 n=1 Tax=Saccoglossus kowalevskii TaxID=10224 RepID=A0ABM0MMP4_SACKO|nr:PREDICTED: transmembrane protein 254-like [Saccoglossus kowalevskii]
MAGKNYFKVAHPFWIVTIGFGITLTGFAAYRPDLVPYHYLGPLGTLTKYLVDNHSVALSRGFPIIWIIHGVEAILTLPVCSMKGIGGSARIKWFLQTFALGIASFYNLLVYHPRKLK